MKCYFVECEESCPDCQGTGVVQHPAWAAYWQEHHGKSLPTPEDDERWFREQGYDETPNEEIPCAECDGRGVLVSRVPLAEALEERLDRLDRALRELAAIVGNDAWQCVWAIITGDDDEEEGADEWA